MGERLKEIKEHFDYCMEDGLLFGEQEEKLLHELYERVERAEELDTQLYAIQESYRQERNYNKKLEGRMQELEKVNRKRKRALDSILDSALLSESEAQTILEALKGVS